MSPIARVAALARKLRGRDPEELRVRAAQALAAWRERTGRAAGALDVSPAALARRLAPGVPSDPAALRARLRAPYRPRFFPALDDPAATIAALRAHAPDDEGAVLARAERLAAGRFDLLGYVGLDYGTPIDWSRDPVSGRRADDDRHWSRVAYLDHDVVGDHKVIWEINRQQYLVTLGQAWLYTRDPRWPALAAEHVSAWMDANPPKQGINWASSLEVAFRAMSWVWTLQLFRDADAFPDAVVARMLAYLHVHARHLEQYLSTYFSPNTHLTGEALGLVFVGGQLPEFAAADRWREGGLAILRDWFPRQVRADGTYFEQATQYHRYTAEFVLQLAVLGNRNGWSLGPIPGLLPGLARVLAALDRGDGTMPLLGDDDGGRLTWLDAAPPDDLRGLFGQLGAVLGDPVLARAARGDVAPALWLLGPAAVPARPAQGSGTPASTTDPADRGEPLASRAFPDGGLWVLASGVGERALHAVLDAGPHGAFNGGHAHADALSLVLSAGGRPLVVDAGTYHYPGPDRNAFRDAGAHNGVLVAGRGASVPAPDPFQWVRQAGADASDWVADPAVTWVRATVSFEPPLRHTRDVLHLPGVGWLVLDELEGLAGQPVEVRWLLAPGLAATPDGIGGCLVRQAHGSPALRLAVVQGQGGWRVEPARVSRRYGAVEPTERLVWQATGDATRIATLLLPCPDGAEAPSVTGLEHDGPGCALRIETADGRSAVEVIAGPVRDRHLELLGVRVDTDARWLVARTDDAADGPRRVAISLHGATLRLGADTIALGAPTAPPRADGWGIAERLEGAWRPTAGGYTAVPRVPSPSSPR